MSAPTPARSWTARTPWRSAHDSALRSFLQTETGSAALLLGATLVALLWANLHGSSYDSFWHTEAAVALGGSEVALDLREWVNTGLMTFFFFVVGLEARREFDMGDLRERQRVTLPVLAGIGGMLVPVLIYLLVNAGRPSVHGWGAAMSTDTAFALGMLALVGRELPERLRSFMLTFTVVDDLVALAVIALVYSSDVKGRALLLSLLVFAVIVAVRAAKVRIGAVYAFLGFLAWLAVLESGVDPVVVGLVMGLLTMAYPADRGRLEQASGLFRSFREQPTPELARSAQVGVRAALSPNERLQLLFHPWTSYVIVPLFALANIGIPVSADFLREAATSPITLGILLGYVVGKPVAVLGVAALVAWLSRGRLQPPVGWAAVAGAGTIAGLGFTVSLLVATLAFSGDELDQAKLGVLTAAAVSSVITWLVFRSTATLPPERRSRLLLGTVEELVDLAVPVDHEREHVRGPAGAPVTVVEYGDFECPYCGQAEPAVRELLADFGNEVRYVWRHLPLSDVHPLAQQAAEASEAAADQGAFWPMHDALLAHQGDLRMPDLLRYAEEIGLDLDRFHGHLRSHSGAERVARDVESADLSGVSGTPTFFINGRRHHGAYDIASLTQAVRTARVRVGLTS